MFEAFGNLVGFGFPQGEFFCDLIIDYEVLTYFNTGMSDVLLAGY